VGGAGLSQESGGMVWSRIVKSTFVAVFGCPSPTSRNAGGWGGASGDKHVQLSCVGGLVVAAETGGVLGVVGLGWGVHDFYELL